MLSCTVISIVKRYHPPSTWGERVVGAGRRMFGMSNPNYAPSDGMALDMSVLGATLLSESTTDSPVDSPPDGDSGPLIKGGSDLGVVDEDADGPTHSDASADTGRSSIPEASFNLINSIVRPPCS